MKYSYSSFDIAAEVYDHKKYKGITKRFRQYEGIKVEDLVIHDPSNLFKRPVGRYLLIEADDIANDQENIEMVLTKCLRSIMKKYRSKVRKVLVVGLGNDDYAPDSLGPKVVKRISVDAHLYFKNKKTRIAAFASGVMAETGLESANIVKALKEYEGFDLIIAIDSLATRRMHRLNKVIQVTDTGISPGAGIGNNRRVINEKTMGIPVIGIGVATIVDSISLVIDSLERTKLSDKDKELIVQEIKNSNTKRLFLATKEIDIEVMDVGRIIANSINKAFG